MLGLLGTVAGAAALEIKRLQKRGSVEELRETKKRERELRELLEATNRELEKVKLHTETVEEKATQMEAKAESLEQQKEQLKQRTEALGQQREQLQQNNSKLLLTNLMLFNKAKHLEDHSRELVAKQEDLQHQLEQVQREQLAQQASFESNLTALKEQVTAVLNRYFSKDIDLQQAIGEMQQMGIEVVPADALTRQHDDAVEFQPRLVLDSPHRMQRLMGMHIPQLTAGLPHDNDVPRLPPLSFPMGISKDPSTGAPRITLGWRTEHQAFGSLTARTSSTGDAKQQQLPDQREVSSSKKSQSAIKDTCSTDKSKAQQLPVSSKAATLQDGPGGAALTFSSPQKAKQSGSTFSLPSFSSLGFRSSSSVTGNASDPMAKGAAMPAILGAGNFKNDQRDEDFITTSKDLVSR